ncbi:MAG: gephyrin-like molybdotransferase Glp, partial [Candidatus Sericytochromatia bacterium]
MAGPEQARQQQAMLPLERAQALVLAAARPVPGPLPLDQAGGLVLAETVISPQPSPLFDNSAMDGFAIAATTGAPQRTVIAEIPAGKTWDGELGPDQALRIMTGAQVPASAEAVVPIEEISVAGNQIEILAAVKPGQHIRRQGEEFRPGDPLLEAGMLLNPAAIGLLASIGQAEVQVYLAPRVAVLATGSELLPIGAPLLPGMLRDSNSPTLAACVREAGALPVLYGILPDEPEAIRAALERAFAENDIVLTSGGVSVGDYDYVQQILLEMGLERIFWKVAIKPGKPVLFGTLAGKLLFGIPGNPASALTVFEVLVRPALRRLLGHKDLYRPQLTGILSTAVKAAPDRLQLLRMIHRDGHFEPLKGQGSSNLLTVARANALLPVYRDYAAGESVTAWQT